jgi:PadR family transcriptional regulator PadR
MGKSDEYLGEFEHMVLLAVMRLGDDAYGAPIRRLIVERAEREVSFGAVYSTLRRLASKGYVEFREEPAGGAGGGRPRRIARMTKTGEASVRAAQLRLQRMADGLLER